MVESHHQTFELRIGQGNRRPFTEWKELWAYRGLLYTLVRRDFVTRYQQTILGPAWFILNPLITTGMFIVVFSRVVGVPTDGIHPALFYLGGLLAWSYFSQTFSATGDTFHSNMHLFGKVYFPRLIAPLAAVISNFISFCLQSLSFVAVYLFLIATDSSVTSRPTIWLISLPLIILHTAILALGTGLLISAVSAKYKDFRQLTSFVMQLWMYGSPIIYPLSRIPERWQWLAILNPMTCIIEGFRAALLGTPGVTPGQYGVSVAITLVVFAAGLISFRHVCRTFVDYV